MFIVVSIVDGHHGEPVHKLEFPNGGWLLLEYSSIEDILELIDSHQVVSPDADGE